MWLRHRARELAPALCLVAVAGCGSSAGSAVSRAHAAARVCRGDQHTVQQSLEANVHRVVQNSNPADIKCLLTGPGLRVDVVAQAFPQVYTQYETMVVHQQQVYGPGIHRPAELPRSVSIPGAYASWVPALQELLATNGGLYRGGSYVTVTLARSPARGQARLRLARAVAVVTLALAPRGPNPGPPPS